jgi:ribulose-bisphosphate carboxylase large chain
MKITTRQLSLSDDRFRVSYIISGDMETARATAEDICLEQSVEFPGDLLPEGFIRDVIVGRIEKLEQSGDGEFRAVISYHADTAACELTQLLNVIFGNISIKPNIKVENLDLPESITSMFRGPRFGVEGIRKAANAFDRPLLSSALKPMGLSASELADMAYLMALGGVDMIKDDHGLSNQHFAPFKERVKLCSDAVRRANEATGGSCLYLPNVTGPYGEVMERAVMAKELGAAGILISPGLTGFDAMRAIADNDEVALPVMSHPAFLGSYVNGVNGISHSALFGQIMRLAGADACVYPNYGGRFSFSREECKSIAAGASCTMGTIRSIFPAPGGGMTLDKVPDMIDTYGRDVIFLVGGGLFRHGDDLAENVRYFRSLIE